MRQLGTPTLGRHGTVSAIVIEIIRGRKLERPCLTVVFLYRMSAGKIIDEGHAAIGARGRPGTGLRVKPSDGIGSVSREGDSGSSFQGEGNDSRSLQLESQFIA